MKNSYLKKMLVRLTVVLAVVLGSNSFVSGAEYSLFTGELSSTLQVARDNPTLPSSLPPASQWRPTVVNPIIAIPEILADGDVLSFSLFNGTIYSAHIEKILTNINGTITVRGSIDGYPLGYVIISTNGNRSLGSIHIPEKGEYYIIQSEPGNNIHYLLNVNVSQLGELEDAPAPIPASLAALESPEMSTLTDTTAGNPLDRVTIDVMIVYTTAARAWANSYGGGIANVIAQAVAKGQLALDNSNTDVTLNLVYSGEVSYTEAGDIYADLDHLTYTTDGYMDEVHALRNQYSADFVGLFTKIDNVGGIGWLLNRISGTATHAFSICRIQQVHTSYTYIHEMGHNMGCNHHKDQITQPGPGLFTYSAGWRWIGNDSGRYCSVMTYPGGQFFSDGQDHVQVAYFSNPGILYNNVATGNSVYGDNARTIRETKAVVAGYRAGSSTTTQIDIGLRYYDGTQIIRIACEQGTFTSPLRISKNGMTYGIVLVKPGDPYASGIIIQTSSGPKALRKL